MCKTIKFHKKLTPEQINDLYDDEELFKNFIKENENNERISGLIKKYRNLDEEMKTLCYRNSIRNAETDAYTEENLRKVSKVMQMGKELAGIKTDILEKY